MRMTTRTIRAIARSISARARVACPERWRWARHPGLWLALGLGAFLRLWHIEVTQFLYDQAGLMALARGAILRPALPVTGIGSSIHTFNPPHSIYLLIPFVALGKDPLAAAISIALWNSAGVALCYLLALRFFGRRVATISALLFAVSGKAVIYSRFIWQQNYLPPLLVLWAFTLYAGCVQGKRGWLAPNVALLALIVALHPTGLLLTPLLLVALFLAPQRPRPREYVLSAGLIAVLLAPTIIWEIVSHNVDLEALSRLNYRVARVDFDNVAMLHQLLGGPAFPFANVGHTYAMAAPSSTYAALGAFHPLMGFAVALLYGASYLILTALVVAPMRAVWPTLGPAATRWRRLVAGLGASWRGLRADPTWRGHLLLWLWVILPPLALIRHSTPLYVHYLLVLYPAVFIMAGVAVEWALNRSLSRRMGMWALFAALPAVDRIAAALTAKVTDWRWSRQRHVRARAKGQAAGKGNHLPASKRSRPSAYRALLLTLVALFIAGEATQSTLFIAAQASGAVDNTYYGYPLNEMRAADTTLAALQRREGTTATYVGTRRSYYSDALRYLLVAEEPGRVGLYGNCVALPAPNAGPALVVSTARDNPDAALLAALPDARRVAALPMPGGEPFGIYRVEGAPALLPGETPLAQVVFRNRASASLRLEAGAWERPNTLRLRWTVLTPSPATATSQWYGVRAHTLDANGAEGRLLAQGSCDATRWRVGETIFTWLSVVTPPIAQGPPATDTSLASQPLLIDVQSRSFALFAPTLGPLRLLSSRLDATLLDTLTPSLATPAGRPPALGSITPAGDFALPAHALDGSPAPP